MNTLNNIEKLAKSIIDICNKDKPVKSEDKDKLIKYQREIVALIDNLTECDNCDVVSDSIATITLNGVTANLCKDCGVKALKEGKIEKKVQRTKKKEKEEKTQSVEDSKSQVLKNKLSQIPRLPNSVVEDLAKTFNNLQDIANAEIKELQRFEGIGKKRALTIKNKLTEIKSQQSTDANSKKNDNSNRSENNKESEIDWNELYTKIQSKTNLKKSEVKRIHKLIDGIAVPMKIDNTITYVTAEIEQSRLNLEQSDMEKAVTMLMDRLSKIKN